MSTDKRLLAFGGRLRRLREKSGFRTGKDFAGRLGWMASKVSRVETGATLPSDSDLAAWLTAVEAPEDVALELHDELLELRLARNSWKRQLRTGHAPRQREHATAEQTATRITMVEFYLVPGLVQTAEYARQLFAMAAKLHQTPADTDEAVRARIRRQDVLYDPSKQIEILVAETALRYPLCSAPVLRAQIDRLITLSALPNVRIGVIPVDTVLPAITMHGFIILDDEVQIEINHTELATVDHDDVELYRRITNELWSVAVEGDEARSLLNRVLDAIGSGG
ncbi:transcriptional regulator with XRE-family HTH domain [Kibdelosporangium banguiense]|uniref:Transcriptional regulator with XRE-family HTH domain n=1 Tax=Kibdelosporangium banguiense TaxID=1365924 RepID=A0ABS4TAF0_9PSEU|nr:helix-turn-helix transcriptional regulator [Kibdelosporangium banguiense]MBP2321391.1 transcriptional regulator with XRE-family HTH domain [Kibdelosporangium banguiense]